MLTHIIIFGTNVLASSWSLLIMNNLVVLFKYLYSLNVMRQTIVEQSELELFTQ